jgi:hypothetical protein
MKKRKKINDRPGDIQVTTQHPRPGKKIHQDASLYEYVQRLMTTSNKSAAVYTDERTIQEKIISTTLLG